MRGKATPRALLLALGLALCSSLLSLSLAAPASAEPADALGLPDWLGDIGFELQSNALYGRIDGSLQTPDGGRPGSTSDARPSLDEIGIERMTVSDTAGELRISRALVTFGAQLVRVRGRKTLTSALVSQNIAFPAGSVVHSKVTLDWYRFGYGFEFPFSLPFWDPSSRAVGEGPLAARDGLRFAPLLEAVILDFDYQLDGSGPGQRVRRIYSRFGARVGGRLEAQHGPFSLRLGGLWGLPVGDLVKISSIEVTTAYRLALAHCAVGLRLGLAYTRIDSEDSQGTPNHVEVDLGPALVAGLTLAF